MNGFNNVGNVMRDFFLSIIHNDIDKFEKILSETDGTCVHCAIVDKSYFDYLNLSDNSFPLGINGFHLVLYTDTLLESDKLQFLDLLVKYGRKSDYRTEISAQDQSDNCYTPLHLAVKKGQSSIVEKLVNYGADIEIQDNYGDTPYHLAAKTSQYKSLSIILGGLDAAKVNLDKSNYEAETLLTMAKHDSKLGNILKMHQARSNVFKVILPVATITFLSAISIYLIIMNKHSNKFQIGKGVALAVAVASAVVMISLVVSLVVLTNKLSAVENAKLGGSNIENTQDKTDAQEASGDLLEGNLVEDISKLSLSKQSSLNNDISYDRIVSNNTSEFKD